MKQSAIVLVFFLFILGVVFSGSFFPSSPPPPVPVAEARSTDNLFGWVWSDMPNDSDENITGNVGSLFDLVGRGAGWISVNNLDLVALCDNGFRRSKGPAATGIAWCPATNTYLSSSTFGNYGLKVRPSGEIIGQAWANPIDTSAVTTNSSNKNNIGWISFSTRAAASGCPSFSPRGNCHAWLDRESGQVVGWARADRGAYYYLPYMNPASTGGWDGWISLSSDNHPPVIDPATGKQVTYGVFAIGCNWHGWAWGGDVLGWISFSPQTSGGTFTGVTGVGGGCAWEPELWIGNSTGPIPSYTLVKGERDTLQLHAWYDPDGRDPTHQKPAYEVTTSSTVWSSPDDPDNSIVYVEPTTGILHAKGRGDTTIKAVHTTSFGGVFTATTTASTTITVLPHSTLIECNPGDPPPCL